MLNECRMCGDPYTPNPKGTYNSQYCSKSCAVADMRGSEYAPTPTPDMPMANCWDMTDAHTFPNGATTREMKAACRNCLHQKECLDYGVKVKVHGVWGGKNYAQRAQLARERGIEREPLAFHYLVPEVFMDRSSA